MIKGLLCSPHHVQKIVSKRITLDFTRQSTRVVRVTRINPKGRYSWENPGCKPLLPWFLDSLCHKEYSGSLQQNEPSDEIEAAQRNLQSHSLEAAARAGGQTSARIAGSTCGQWTRGTLSVPLHWSASAVHHFPCPAHLFNLWLELTISLLWV